MGEDKYVIEVQDVLNAAKTISNAVHRTPVLTCDNINRLASDEALEPRSLFFKCELFQKSGSFKARGACNAVFQLPEDDLPRGVCTHSSGNHAQALALAANIRGARAQIVMPSNAPEVKKQAVLGYGASICECAPTQKAREDAAAAVVAETGAVFIHPSENPFVIAGQGTVALEILEQVKELLSFGEKLDVVVIPIGGGGLISGMSTVLKALSPDTKVIGAEPRLADDAYWSKKLNALCDHAAALQQRTQEQQSENVNSDITSNNPNVLGETVADGLRTVLGPNTWPIVRDKVDNIVRVGEEEILRAMELVYTRMKLAIEPSAAVSLAVALSDEFKKTVSGKNVAVVLCGGNVDVRKLPFK